VRNLSGIDMSQRIGDGLKFMLTVGNSCSLLFWSVPQICLLAVVIVYMRDESIFRLILYFPGHMD
jgi:hypothetical protein